ncbi:MAG: threonine synthase [Chlamydiales bacterium]
MLFDSTSHQVRDVSFRQAVYQGFSPDGGLYIPKTLPQFSHSRLKKMHGLSFFECLLAVGSKIFQNEMTRTEIQKVFEEAFNFPAPFLSFSDNLHTIELFHGPTFSFKDFGARFMATLIKYWRKKEEEIVILVATSGDTGSAVGQAFCGIEGVKVYILYPKGLVTSSQEKQLTTMGQNVTALEVAGTFEQCQQLLKKACLDPDLKKGAIVTTANSINVARLFPQALYYFYAYSRLPENDKPVIFSVPCGNFGHLVSGILAKRMGLPIDHFLGVTNINDEVPLYLKTGIFQPHTAYQTIAVSMDVGDPSNFPRLLELYDHSREKMQKEIVGISFEDKQVKLAIQQVLKKHHYLLDPHSAFAYLALYNYLNEKRPYRGIFFETAHPAKFIESLKPLVSKTIDVPGKLKQVLTKPKQAIEIPPTYSVFKNIIYEKTAVL